MSVTTEFIKNMEKEYSDCYYCGGMVQERLIPREVRWKGQLFVFENVPVGVCNQCGEKVIKPRVAKEIDHFLEGKIKPARTIQVPVYQYQT